MIFYPHFVKESSVVYTQTFVKGGIQLIGFTGKMLRSEHLSFRLLSDSDKNSLFQILHDPETTLPAGFTPILDRNTFEVFWKSLTEYNTGIAILLQDKCIGYFHVHPCQLNEPDFYSKKNVMIGFLIGKKHLRRGYGTETLVTLNPYLLQQFDCIWGDYFEGNTASKELLQKCGFRPISTYDMRFDELGGKTMHVFSNVLCR